MGNAHGSVKEKIDIRRLHTEIGKVLEKLKRTPWKKVDGSFKKYVKDGLKHLDNAYEKLDHPQFEKAQNDITKAIIEAKIISNICSVLTFLFKENRELSVSHKYDGISSIATRILCNYANAEEFAIEVANCPGFLEFICELLAESSENFLQIDTQVRFCKLLLVI